jgi:hypothetical protein
MNTSPNEGSAKIYQFPVGGRAALGGRRYGEAAPVSLTPRVNEAVCSGSWYHDEAIREAQSQTKPWEH